MASRIDDIFSPEKLRRSWKPDSSKNKRPGKNVSLPSTKAGKVHAEFKRLYELAIGRFHGEQLEALDIMMSELKDLLMVKFPEFNFDKTEGNASKNDNNTLNPAIEVLLDQIEEFIDALSAGDI